MTLLCRAGRTAEGLWGRGGLAGNAGQSSSSNRVRSLNCSISRSHSGGWAKTSAQKSGPQRRRRRAWRHGGMPRQDGCVWGLVTRRRHHDFASISCCGQGLCSCPLIHKWRRSAKTGLGQAPFSQAAGAHRQRPALPECKTWRPISLNDDWRSRGGRLSTCRDRTHEMAEAGR